jgi:pyruvate, orthophosphate dikinase
VPVEGMRELCEQYKKVYRQHVGDPFPQDPLKQLELAIEAVFKSWNADRPSAIAASKNHPGLCRHGGQRADDGLRQHGR